MVAEFTAGFGLATWATIWSTRGPAVSTVPTFQTPVPLVYVPWLVVADRNVRPAGIWSCTVTLVAVSGPVSLSVMVQVMVSPTLGVELLTALVRARSACCGVSVTLALLLAEFGSYWSARVIDALLVWALALLT